MAASEAAAAPGTAPEAVYDEGQCIAALASLERLQQQLDDLRLTLPRVVKPFHMPTGPPMYHAFKESLTKSTRDMKDFRKQWQSADTQDVFEHAKKSKAANGDLSACVQVDKYGWIEKEEREKEKAKKMGELKDRVEDVKVQITKEERDRIVEEWKKTHPTLKLQETDEGKQLMIRFANDSLIYRFRVTISYDPDAPQPLKAECDGTKEPFTGVSRCIESRPNANDLKYLLDMIAAYKTVEGWNCATCNMMVDQEATRTKARRSRHAISADEKVETVWEAFHEGCLQ